MTHYDRQSLLDYVDTERFKSTYLGDIEDEGLRGTVQQLISKAVAGDPNAEGAQPLGMLGQYLATVIEDAEEEMRDLGMDDNAIHAALSVVGAAIERVKEVAKNPDDISAPDVLDVAGHYIL